MLVRQRVAALIERDGNLLVVRQRARGALGRHDGVQYLTPPGGGVEPGESWAQAVAREVMEETGLIVTSTSFVCRINHPGGSTAVFSASVEAGVPVLGVDPDIECDCPRLVGLEWVPAPPHDAWWGPEALSTLKVEVSADCPTV